MDIDAAITWQIEDVRRKKHAISRDDDNVGVQVVKGFFDVRVFQSSGLKDGYSVIQSRLFNGRHFKLHSPALAAVGTGKYGLYLVMACHKGLETVVRKIGGAHKNHIHKLFFLPAAVILIGIDISYDLICKKPAA